MTKPECPDFFFNFFPNKTNQSFLEEGLTSELGQVRYKIILENIMGLEGKGILGKSGEGGAGILKDSGANLKELIMIKSATIWIKLTVIILDIAQIIKEILMRPYKYKWLNI